MYRVENKYLLSPTSMYELEKRIADVLEPDPHNKGNHGYKISSLYFDDLYDSCLQDNLAGNPHRTKYRIRMYDDSFDFIQLETKSKTYSWTLKHSTPISREEMILLMNGECINVPDCSTLDNPRNAFNISIRNRVLRPRVIVSYDRKAYICEAGNVRITFDCNLRGSNWVDEFGNPDLIYDYPKDVTGCVLEVKYDEFIPDYILQLLETTGMLRVNNSKYVICRQIYQ